MNLRHLDAGVALAIALFAPFAAPARAAHRVAAADETMTATYREARAAALAGEDDTPTFATRATTAGTRLLLPYFEVDRQNPGTTTLFGVRSAAPESQTVTFTYLDRLGRTTHTETSSLGPHQTLTVNLRDLQGLGVEEDGLARGLVIVDSTAATSGDWFQVDVDHRSATGSRMVKDGDSTFCRVWDVRYADGGAFQGGTELTVVVGNPLGTAQRSDSVAAMIEVFDETGSSYGVVFFWTDYLVNRLDIREILDTLPTTPANGAIEIVFADGTGGGLVEADFAGAQEYAVGFDGNCVAAP